MIEFFTASHNIFFTVSLLLLLIIGILEGLTTVLGFAASSFIESMLPSLDMGGELDVDAEGLDIDEVGSTSSFSRIMGWVNVGRVPFLVIIILFLFSFGGLGLTLQSFSHRWMGLLLPGVIAVPITFFPSFICVRYLSRLVGKLIPKDETESVSERSFIGRVAEITLGNASCGKPAQAKLKDIFGHAHYILVEPEEKDEVLPSGSQVLLVRQQSATFFAILNPNTALVDEVE